MGEPGPGEHLPGGGSRALLGSSSRSSRNEWRRGLKCSVGRAHRTTDPVPAVTSFDRHPTGAADGPSQALVGQHTTDGERKLVRCVRHENVLTVAGVEAFAPNPRADDRQTPGP